MKMKSAKYVSLGNHLICCIFEESLMIDIATNYHKFGILLHFCLLSTCQQHVGNISNLGSMIHAVNKFCHNHKFCVIIPSYIKVKPGLNELYTVSHSMSNGIVNIFCLDEDINDMAATCAHLGLCQPSKK